MTVKPEGNDNVNAGKFVIPDELSNDFARLTL